MNPKKRSQLFGYIVCAAATAAVSLDATAAPQDKVLFENQHIRFIEVTRWPGEKSAIPVEPYAAIIAVDAAWPAVTDPPLGTRRRSAIVGCRRSSRSIPGVSRIPLLPRVKSL